MDPKYAKYDEAHILDTFIDYIYIYRKSRHQFGLPEAMHNSLEDCAIHPIYLETY